MYGPNQFSLTLTVIVMRLVDSILNQKKTTELHLYAKSVTKNQDIFEEAAIEE